MKICGQFLFLDTPGLDPWTLITQKAETSLANPAGLGDIHTILIPVPTRLPDFNHQLHARS
ncbi:MAG: hypothetical protein CMN05_05460 [Roseibacillus sp.]|nr:hypothetical protein [Roseibacillus sp.]